MDKTVVTVQLRNLRLPLQKMFLIYENISYATFVMYIRRHKGTCEFKKKTTFFTFKH